jgi:dTDP-4-dehydrorhamnose reductase
MKILLTGEEGQLGRLLKPALIKLGKLIAVDRVSADLSDLKKILILLERVKPDLIVNSAAYTNVDGAESNPDFAMTVNGLAPGVMARWAADHGASMIHFSTDYVFDGSGEEPWHEYDDPNPINVYGESKSLGDSEIIASGAPSLILRTSWVYAAQGKNFMNTMLHLAKERSNLRVVSDQIGSPTPASLLVNMTCAIIRQANSDLPGLLSVKGGILNITPTGETSWHGFAEAIFESLKVRGTLLKVKTVDPISSSEFPLPARRPLNSRLALEKIGDRFNLTLPYWRDAMESVLDESVSPRSI